MKRLMQDLGDLTGLDIVAAMQGLPGSDSPEQGAESRSERIPRGADAAVLRGAMRWLGFASRAGGRCRATEQSCAD